MGGVGASLGFSLPHPKIRGVEVPAHSTGYASWVFTSAAEMALGGLGLQFGQKLHLSTTSTLCLCLSQGQRGSMR
jgi:hypothetical protein